MARVPLTKEEVVPTRLVLNVEKVGLTEEQFFQLCSDNGDLRMELTAQKELIIMSPTGLKSGWRELVLATRLMNWAESDGTGIAFGPSSGYTLPDGAILGPDASWVRRERLAGFSDDELEKFAHVCPDFAGEVMSPSDKLAELQDKMAEYIANGAQLGWLIDPFEARVYIYRPGQAVECLENPTTISGDPVLSRFVFNVAEITSRSLV
jgi:Uma2 family endonuclease